MPIVAPWQIGREAGGIRNAGGTGKMSVEIAPRNPLPPTASTQLGKNFLRPTGSRCLPVSRYRSALLIYS